MLYNIWYNIMTNITRTLEQQRVAVGP